MVRPPVPSRAESLAARGTLLATEKEAARLRDAYDLLDLTPLRRGEARPMQWVRHRDRHTV